MAALQSSVRLERRRGLVNQVSADTVPAWSSVLWVSAIPLGPCPCPGQGRVSPALHPFLLNHLPPSPTSPQESSASRPAQRPSRAQSDNKLQPCHRNRLNLLHPCPKAMETFCLKAVSLPSRLSTVEANRQPPFEAHPKNASHHPLSRLLPPKPLAVPPPPSPRSVPPFALGLQSATDRPCLVTSLAAIEESPMKMLVRQYKVKPRCMSSRGRPR